MTDFFFPIELQCPCESNECTGLFWVVILKVHLPAIIVIKQTSKQQTHAFWKIEDAVYDVEK